MDTPLPDKEDIDLKWWYQAVRDLSEPYCPSCEPERDPFKGVTIVEWCKAHRPELDGDKDARASNRPAVWPGEMGF